MSVATPRAQQSLTQRSPAGVNLATHSYYSAGWVFTDVFKHAAQWWSQSASSSVWQTSTPLDLDADGWVRSLQPDQAAGTLIFRDVAGRYPGGRYIVLYDGDGDLQCGFDAREVTRSSGRIEIDVNPSGSGIYFKLTRTDPANYLRNIRVVHSSMQGRKSSFHPRFLTYNSVFGTLRFMDWQHTNGSPVQDWSQRTRATSYTQTLASGVALEYMVELCNELGANAWFCMPHLASDDYVRSFAEQVRDTLDPSLKVYVEYSNEVWNSTFPQANYARQAGLARGLSANSLEAQLRFYSERSSEVHAIWCDAFGGSSRLQRVLASQNANPWTATEIMDWKNAAASADVLAVAPYFGGNLGDPATQNTIQQMTVNEVLYASYLDLLDVMKRACENADAAKARGLQTVAYEGGQHLVGYAGSENNAQLTALFAAANRHAYMGLLMRYFLTRWRDAGGTLLVTYESTSRFTKWGSWGLTEAQDQDPLVAPKFWATLDYIFWNPRWW